MRIVKPAAVRREEIVDCAARLFAANGYDGTSVNDIIASLGISKGAFYHYFRSKDELLEALAERVTRTVARDAEGILSDPALDPYARLSAFLQHSRSSKVAMAADIRATFEAVLRAENVQLYHRTHAAVAAVIRPILARVIREGVADRSFDTRDPDTAAAVIVQLIVTTRELVAELFRPGLMSDLDAVTERLAQRLDYLGTVVDRILGIPEGSIRLAEREELRALTVDLFAPSNAA